MTGVRLLAAGLLAGALVAPAVARPAHDLLVRNAHVIDGTDAPARDGVDILVRAGRIVAIDRGLAAADVPVLDVAGASVLPGLLVQGGFTPREAILATTRTPARTLGLDAEIGSVEIGKRADLVVVAGDPLADVAALRNVRWTIRDGEAHTPAEWMAEP
jgi:imidazolonepropionase-like amidohydrolase